MLKVRICVAIFLFMTCVRAWAADVAADIVGGMTLEQKIGQMIMPSIRNFSKDGELLPVRELPDELAAAMRRIGPCGYILFSENCSDVEQMIRLTDSLRAASPIQPFIAVDQEGGRVARIPFVTTMGGNMALAATDDPAGNARDSAAIIAAELAALGINVDLAPVADVNSDPSNPIIGIRSFSDAPATVADCASAFADGLRSRGVSAVYKHFPGHGDTDTDSHTGLPSVNKSIEELRECELIPFARGIADGVEMIMTAHIQFPQIERETYRSISDGREIYLPATLSRRIITDLLRVEMGFGGIVITDSLSQMAAIREHFSPAEAARLAIGAGVDILLMPIEMTDAESIADMERLIAEIARMAREGIIDIDNIDKAACRIISQKVRMGLLDDHREDDIETKIEFAKGIVGCEAHRETERRIMRDAVTVLRTKDGVFRPMRPTSSDEVLIFYPQKDLATLVDAAVDRLKSDGLLPQGCVALCCESEAPDLGALADAGYVVLISYTSSVADMTGDIATRMRYIMLVAAGAGARVQVLSAGLPCDAQLFPGAEAVIASYGTRNGPNISEALCAMFGGCIPRGRLPMDVMKLSVGDDGSCLFTDEVIYPRGTGSR